MGMPVVVVASGGLPVVEVQSRGAPVTIASNGRGVPVTLVATYGLPVVFETIGLGGGLLTLPALALNATHAVTASLVGDTVAVVMGKTAGSALLLTDASGRLALAGNTLRVAATMTATTLNFTITETLSGYTTRVNNLSLIVVVGRTGTALNRAARLDTKTFDDSFTSYPDIYHPTLNVNGRYATFFAFGADGTEAGRYAAVASRTLSYVNGSGNHEAQVYSDQNFTPTGGIDPFEVTPGGGLVIKATLTPPGQLAGVSNLPAVSGLLRTRSTGTNAFSPINGFYEARFLNELKPGYWSAVWMYEAVGQDGAELDVQETGPIFSQYAGAHLFQNTHGTPDGDIGYAEVLTTRPDQAYRTVAVEWSPTLITYYIDNVVTKTAFSTPTAIQEAMHLLLNLAVGYFAYPESPAGWSGNNWTVNGQNVAFDPAQMPFKYYVDYHRYWSLQAPVAPPAPTFPLVFTSTMPANLTFNRGSDAYAENAAGTTLTKFASDVPARTDKGLLIEPAGTALSIFPTFPINAAITDSTTTLPDGSSGTSKRVTENATASVAHLARGFPVITTGQQYAISGYVRRAVGTRHLRISNGNGGTYFAVFDLTAATVATAGGTTGATISAKSNGWHKIDLRGTGDATGEDLLDIYNFTGTTTGTSQFFTGDGTSALEYWGIQLEARATATSPMPSGSRAGSILSFTVPAGVTSITYTFDDNSTQVVSGLTPGATYTVPTNLNRPYIKSIA